jgi:hypothetical protein
MFETQNLNNSLEKLIEKSIEKFSYKIEDMINDSSIELESLPEIINELANIITLIEGTNHLDKITSRKIENNNEMPEIVKLFFRDMTSNNKEEIEPKKKRTKKDD